MGWAETRIQQYAQGQKATWLETRALEHANPVHFALDRLGAMAVMYGLWTHNWLSIVIGVLLIFSGHLYTWVMK